MELAAAAARSERPLPVSGLTATIARSTPRQEALSCLAAVEAFEEVSDSLCVPQYNKDGEERVILFLKVATNQEFSPDLVKRIREAIRVALSARHVPSLILETEGIPVCQHSPFFLLLTAAICFFFSFSPWNSN
ncbi:Hypothetical predicted protein [Podarcis lilfordi]|uniref:Uncharacterized protein n=1 Tax=Podarcis lilfordi TaxID=74358 RepID=A0AA35LJA9_9SAUR|nr:Hypothetical predicted protein [Podarcis lilfordi]